MLNLTIVIIYRDSVLGVDMPLLYYYEKKIFKFITLVFH